MRAVVYDFKESAFAVVDDVPRPEPKDGEVLVKMTGAAINPVDTMIPNLLPKFMEQLPPRYVAGVDGAGIVAELGGGVASPAVGTRVIFHRPTVGTDGGFAEFCCMPAAALVEVPASLGDTVAAAIPCAAWTAYQIVYRKCHVGAGDSVLVYGASGGTGSFVTQFCAVKGASTIIAVCSGKNHAYAATLGATHCVDYRTENVAKRVREITGGAGVRVAVDLVGAETAGVCCSVLGYNGVLCPAATPDDGASQLFEVLRGAGLHGKAASVTFIGFGGGHFGGAESREFEEMMSCAREATRVIADTPIPVEISAVVSLDGMVEALASSAQMGTRGKAVLML